MTYRTRTVHSIDVDGEDVELYHAPCDWVDPLTKFIGEGHLVVAYLSHDDSPSNPMTDFDCQGDLYTKSSHYGGGVITDSNKELYRALGLDHYGGVDIDKDFSCDPYIGPHNLMRRTTDLRTTAARQMFALLTEDQILDWAGKFDLGMGEASAHEIWLKHFRAMWIDLEDPNGWLCEEVEELALSLYPTYWRQIVGPYVVPMNYLSERGSTDITVDNWDGDPDNVPNAVWVADSGAEANITAMPKGVTMEYVSTARAYVVSDDGHLVFTGQFSEAWSYIKSHYTINQDDLIAAATKYAESVCDEYAKWCCGDVWGCVVETFERKACGWEQVNEDACWGYIGQEYAEEALKGEYFDPAVKRLEEEIATQGGAQEPLELEESPETRL